MAKKKTSISLSNKHISKLIELKKDKSMSSAIEYCIDMTYMQSTLDREIIKNTYLELVDCVNDIEDIMIKKEISEKLGDLICHLLK